ncbi:MFS transporter [Neobacillus sp. NRS-1170]|uniref:MFS transporter n=1 Tax=Neobacillus sp. NRS-1170 TaxID=3233898 RepID=UPI003D276337
MSLFFKKDPYKVYIFTCFLSQLFFTFIFTMNLLYQVEIVKLDPLQLVLVGTVLEAAVFLFEIPTGIVSDLKSRKLSILIGYFLIGIGFILEGMFPYFIAVIASQIVWGIGYTFTSGAQQAWIADEIGKERASDAFIKGANAGNLGKMIAIPLSMLTGYFMINLPIVLGGFGMIGLSVLLYFLMKEEHFKPVEHVERVSSWKTIKDNMNQIIAFSKRSSLMRILFLIALFFGFYSEGFDRLWIPHILKGMELRDLAEGRLVFLVGGIQFIVVIFSFAALHFISKSSISQKLTSIYAALFTGSVLIITSLVGFALSSYLIVFLIFYIIIQVARYVMHPLEDIWLNQMIPDSSTRATFFSVKGQVDAIGQISGGPVIGLIAVNFTIKIAILTCAFLLTPVLVLYRKILKK